MAQGSFWSDDDEEKEEEDEDRTETTSGSGAGSSGSSFSTNKIVESAETRPAVIFEQNDPQGAPGARPAPIAGGLLPSLVSGQSTGSVVADVASALIKAAVSAATADRDDFDLDIDKNMNKNKAVVNAQR